MTGVKKKKVVNFTEGPLLWKMILFALPIIGNQLLQVCYNTTDMVVVGYFAGEDIHEAAVAAVGACGPLIRIFINVFFGIASGVGICVAQKIGAGAYDQVERYIHTSAVFSFIGGVVLMTIGLIATEPLLEATGVHQAEDPIMFAECVAYMRTYLVGLPAMMVLNFLSASLRASGITLPTMIFMAISGAANVVVNLIMVAGFGMGAAGVGIGTTVAQTMAAVMIVVYMMCCRDRIYHFSFKKLCFDVRKLGDIVRNGLPVGVQNLILSFSNVIVQTEVNSYGTPVIAGITAASNLEGYVSIAMSSVSVAVLTVISQNIGARKYDRVKKVIWLSILATTVIGILVGVLFNVFGEQLLAIYNIGENAESLAAGKTRLLIVCLPYFICGFMEVLSSALKGMKRSITAMITSLVGLCVFKVAWITFVCPLFPRDLEHLPVLLIVFPLAWLITGLTKLVAIIICFHRDKKKAMLSQPKPEEI